MTENNEGLSAFEQGLLDASDASEFERSGGQPGEDEEALKVRIEEQKSTFVDADPENETTEENPEPEKETPSQPEKTVPLQALREEREKRQAAQAELNKLSGKIDLMMQALQSAPQAAQAEEKAVKPEDDPVGFIQQQIQKLSSEQQKFSEMQQQQMQQNQQIMMENAVADCFQSDMNEMRVEYPDIDSAASYLINSRKGQYKAFGYNENQINGILHNEMIGFVREAKKHGLNAAQVAYNMALAAGYKNTVSRPSNMEKSIQKIQQAEKGRSENRTLAAVAGGAPVEEMTLEMLDKMSEKEFSNWKTKNPKAWEKLMMDSMSI